MNFWGFPAKEGCAPAYLDVLEQGFEEIQEITGVSRASVNNYLPYSKVVYKMSEISRNAGRIQKYRMRKAAVEKLTAEPTEGNLWNCIVMFQGYTFHTVSGLPFTYSLKVGRDGEFSKELFIDRRENSKNLSWSSVKNPLAAGEVL